MAIKGQYSGGLHLKMVRGGVGGGTAMTGGGCSLLWETAPAPPEPEGTNTPQLLLCGR